MSPHLLPDLFEARKKVAIVCADVGVALNSHPDALGSGGAVMPLLVTAAHGAKQSVVRSVADRSCAKRVTGCLSLLSRRGHPDEPRRV